MKVAFERGHKLGKYEILGRLSVGGMAELYLALLTGQGGFRKFVALKRVLPAIAEKESFLKMFLDEARITASLSHAAIAQVYELAEDPQSHEPMLAMEFVAGQNLEQIIQRAKARKVPIPLGFTCRVAHELLMALHFAHGFVEPASGKPMPVIHRDINPRNVMVTYTGGTKIVDFGIAKARGRLDQTQVGMVKGTLQYMAPEQVTAQEVDGRTDLYAASMMLYELFSGRHPFEDDPTQALTMMRIVEGQLPSLLERNPSLPPDLVAAIMKGLEVQPARRWRTGREYARAVDRAVPETFDDDQVSAFMAKLFADKIAVTRSLLSSGSEASPADLRMMTMLGDEDGPVPLESTSAPTVPQRPVAVATAMTVETLQSVQSLLNQRTEVRLDPVDASTDKHPLTPVRRKSSQEVAKPVVVVRRPASDRQLASAPRGGPAVTDASETDLDATTPGKETRPIGLIVVLVLAIAFVLGLSFYVWGHN